MRPCLHVRIIAVEHLLIQESVHRRAASGGKLPAAGSTQNASCIGFFHWQYLFSIIPTYSSMPASSMRTSVSTCLHA
jgi:hypothetical protein